MFLLYYYFVPNSNGKMLRVNAVLCKVQNMSHLTILKCVICRIKQTWDRPGKEKLTQATDQSIDWMKQ